MKNARAKCRRVVGIQAPTHPLEVVLNRPSIIDHRSSVIIISLDTAFRAFVPGATYFCDARLTSGRVAPDTKTRFIDLSV